MTEVPEHLLRRSRERRAALGLDAGEGGESPAPAAAAPAEAPAATEEPAAGVTVPAPVDEAAVPAVPDEVAAALPVAVARRMAVPVWVLPVLVALPIWALVYAYALDTGGSAAALTPVQRGSKVFAANCASCHLADGAGDSAGGVGRQLNDGQVTLTFPNEADHLAFVKGGSPAQGTPYGSPDRPGGQHVAKGGMPAWGGVLSDDDLTAVVAYEREGLK